VSPFKRLGVALLATAAGACASSSMAGAPPDACRATAPVLARLGAAPRAAEAPIEAGAAPGRPPGLRTIAPTQVGGIWQGETPPLDLFRRWAGAAPVPASACHPSQAAPASSPPGPDGVTRVAVAVLDAGGREAVVAVEVTGPPMGARRDLYYLRQVGGEWKVVGVGQLSVA
jgi:hypothetical protein